MGETGSDGTVVPNVIQFIKDYYGTTNKVFHFKCRVEHCNKDVAYSPETYYNLKDHYRRCHSNADYLGLMAAISAGYAYNKKRKRNPSEMR